MKQETSRYLSRHMQVEVDLSTIVMEPGTYCQIHVGGQCVEVKMLNDGRALVYITPEVAVHSFEEIYGK